MHTEIFDGNKNNIELPESQTKPSADFFKQQKGETILPSTNQDVPIPTRDTSSENIDVTTVPVTSAENNDAVTTIQSQQQPAPTTAHIQLQQITQVKPTQVNSASINSLVALSTTDAQQTPQPQQPTLQPPHGYTREILPPNSIYGIESLTSKPYEPNDMKLPEGIHSPRYPAHNIQSPHHSSPDKDPNRTQQHRTDNNWVSPVKAHNYRAQIPPTSPYVDGRDPNYPAAAAAAAAARRYVPPSFYANGRNYMHPNDRTARYNGYPLGSPLMATLGYPRDGLDTRYPLHMPTNLGFEEEKFKLSPPSIDDKHIWTKQEVELLLDLYEEHKSKLQDPRVRKTKVWDDIAKQIHEKLDADVNGCQCNQKFRNMKADYQKVVEHNARSGSFRKTCKYYERLEKLLTPVGEQDKLKEEMENNTAKYFNANANGANATNGAFNQASNNITNGSMLPNGFYENGISRTSSSPESEGNRMYENGTNSSGGTPSSPGKRALETASDDSSPPPSKRQCNECNSCGGVNKRELIELLKEFLKEQRKREEETIQRIQILHKEKIDTVVKFLDLFQELVKKV